MKTTFEVVTTTILTLTETERQWLRSYLQNSLAIGETLEDRQMRKVFFEALDRPKVLS